MFSIGSILNRWFYVLPALAFPTFYTAPLVVIGAMESPTSLGSSVYELEKRRHARRRYGRLKGSTRSPLGIF